MENKLIQLTTYGTVLGEESKNEIVFEVPEKWLVRKVEFLFESTLEDFMNDYTWDSSEVIFIFAEREGVIISCQSPKEQII